MPQFPRINRESAAYLEVHTYTLNSKARMRHIIGVLSHTTPTSSDKSHIQLKWGR